MTGLEDGRVLIAGDGAPAALYLPALARFQPLAGGPEVAEHGAALLGDGTVLLAGGRSSDGAPVASAWVLRPELVGPFTGSLTVSFAGSLPAEHLVPSDPARARLQGGSGVGEAYYTITSSGGSALPSAWAVIAGPVFERVQLGSSVRSSGGGVALLLGFRDPDTYLAVVLAAGQPATAYKLVSGAVTSSCTGDLIRAGQLAPPERSAQLAASYDGSTVTASIDGQLIMTCSELAPERGLAGIGVTGPDGAVIRVDLLSVRR